MSGPSGTPFPRRVLDACAAKESAVVVGLDPRLDFLPEPVRRAARAAHGRTREAVGEAFFAFGREIIDAVADAAVAVKPQLAFYEQYGAPGVHALERTVAHARARGLLVILDGKRNDIGSTAEAYAGAYLGDVPFWDGERSPGLVGDALTVNAYLGRDGVEPFLTLCRERGSGIFVLVRTSNPSAGEFQDLPVDGSGPAGARLVDRLAQRVVQWNEGLPVAGGYAPVGAVVGATHPQDAARLRERMPGVLFLVPGYGSQGGTAADVVGCFDAKGGGALVNSSRDIIFAFRREPWRTRYGEQDFAAAARAAALAMRDALREALRAAGKGG